MVQIKYSLRQINVQAHSQAMYLCRHEDGMHFSYADYPTKLFLFDIKEDAVDYIRIKNLDYCEIFEVYYNEK